MLLHFCLRKDVTIIKKITILLLIVSILASLIIIPSYANGSSTKRDITTTSVTEDLSTMAPAGMSFQKSDTENIFFGMSQCMVPTSDGSMEAKTYVYLNWKDSISQYFVIRLSMSVSDEEGDITENYDAYDMKLCSQDGTWCKYEVLGLENARQTTRRYRVDYIQGMYYSDRLYVNEVRVFNGISNESIEVFAQEFATINIESKLVKFVTYGRAKFDWNKLNRKEGNLNYDVEYDDAWFVFFNTDKDYNIDQVQKIEITYRQRDYRFVSISQEVLMSQAFTTQQISDRLTEMSYDDEYKDEYANGHYYITPPTTYVEVVERGITTVEYGNGDWKEKDKLSDEVDNIKDLRDLNIPEEDDLWGFNDLSEQFNFAVMFKVTSKWAENEKNGTLIEASLMEQVAILSIEYLDKSGSTINAYAIDLPTDEFEGSSAPVGDFNDWLKDVENSFEDFKKKLSDFKNKASEFLPMVLLVIIILFVGPYILPFIMPVLKILITGFIKIFKFVINLILVPIKALTKRKRE